MFGHYVYHITVTVHLLYLPHSLIITDEISHYHRRVLEKHYGFPKFKYHVMKTTIFIGLILITSTVGSSLKESANNLPLVGGTVSGGINTGPIIQNSITKTKCLLSEYECTNGKCISIDKYCDKRDDCGDNSDEPRFCSSNYKQFLFFFAF